MKSSEGQECDLFGNAVEPLRDRRGRPLFAKSKENQSFVAVRAAAGWSQARIAEALGCDDATLRKHFSGELENGRLIIEGEMLDVLQAKVRHGHTASIRLLREIVKETAPRAPRREKPDGKEAAKPDTAAGKKQQRFEAAGQRPDEWGDIYDQMNAADEDNVQ